MSRTSTRASGSGRQCRGFRPGETWAILGPRCRRLRRTRWLDPAAARHSRGRDCVHGGIHVDFRVDDVSRAAGEIEAIGGTIVRPPDFYSPEGHDLLEWAVMREPVRQRVLHHPLAARLTHGEPQPTSSSTDCPVLECPQPLVMPDVNGGNGRFRLGQVTAVALIRRAAQQQHQVAHQIAKSAGDRHLGNPLHVVSSRHRVTRIAVCSAVAQRRECRILGEVVLVGGVMVADVGAGCELGSFVECE